jgi:hypothetical protein
MIAFADCSTFFVNFYALDFFDVYFPRKILENFEDPVPRCTSICWKPCWMLTYLPYGDAGWLVVILAQSVIAPHLKEAQSLKFNILLDFVWRFLIW